MLFDYLVIVIDLKLASIAQKCFVFFNFIFVDKNPVLAKYQMHPLIRIKLIVTIQYKF